MNQPVETFCETLRSLFPAAQVRLERFPSGAYFLDIILFDRLFVIEYAPRRGYGIGEVKDREGAFNSGHPYASDNWEGASQRLLSVLNDCVAGHIPAGQAKSA